MTEIGFAGENFVAADLIKKGYTPFKPELPTSEVDMIAYRNNKLLKLQIKTSIPKENGVMLVDLRRGSQKDRNYRRDSFDYLCIVNGDTGEVIYLEWSRYWKRKTINLRTRNFEEKACSGKGIYFNDFLLQSTIL